MPRSRAAAPPPLPPSDAGDRAYHHGSLRAALVAEARRLLVERGLDALTLRAVARAAGVSQTAPYRHFADRRALVAAVAAEGFAALEAAMVASLATAADGSRSRGGLRAVADAYLDFARANPALYRLMFGPEVANTADLPALAAAARGALGVVGTAIAGLQAAGLVRPADPGTLAVTIWAALHGLTSLLLDGQARTDADPDALTASLAETLMFGLAPRAAGAGPAVAARPPRGRAAGPRR